MKNQGAPGTPPKDEEKELFWKVNKEWRNMSEEQVQTLWNKQQELKKPKPKNRNKPASNSTPTKQEQPNGKIKT